MSSISMQNYVEQINSRVTHESLTSRSRVTTYELLTRHYSRVKRNAALLTSNAALRFAHE